MRTGGGWGGGGNGRRSVPRAGNLDCTDSEKHLNRTHAHRRLHLQRRSPSKRGPRTELTHRTEPPSEQPRTELDKRTALDRTSTAPENDRTRTASELAPHQKTTAHPPIGRRHANPSPFLSSLRILKGMSFIRGGPCGSFGREILRGRFSGRLLLRPCRFPIRPA